MNFHFLGQPKLTDQYSYRKLGLNHALQTTNATKLKLSQECPPDKCSWKIAALSDFSWCQQKSIWPVKCA